MEGVSVQLRDTAHQRILQICPLSEDHFRCCSGELYKTASYTAIYNRLKYENSTHLKLNWFTLSFVLKIQISDVFIGASREILKD